MRFAPAAVAALAAGVLLAGSAGAAAAASADTDPGLLDGLAPVTRALGPDDAGTLADTTTASPVSSDALPTVQIDGVVWTQAVVGDTVYVGGDFSAARPAGAAPGTQEVPRRNLLAYDLTTGELVQGWAPQVNGQVKDLAVSADGSRLYVAGQFTSVDGTTRYRAAAFNTRTGALTAFRPSVNAVVNAVATVGGDVFLGGAFTSVNNRTRARVAAVDAATGAKTRSFAARVADRSVQDIAISPDGGQVVLAGNFTSVDGSQQPGYGLARLDSTTGDSLPLPANEVVRNAGANAAILSLNSDDDYFYGTGYLWNKKGSTEGSFAASWETGRLVWLEDCHGDTYSIEPFAGVLFSASHKHNCSTSGGFPGTKPRTYHHGTAATRTVEGKNIADDSGYPDSPGTPRPELLNWYPDFQPGTYTGLGQGPWHVTSAGNYLLYGGEFRKVNNRPQQGLVRFAVRDVAANADGPRLGGANFALRLTVTPRGAVKATWPSNYDRDDLTLTYSLYRGTTSDGPIEVQERAGGFWEKTTMSYTDQEAEPGSTQRYAVVARDPWGNAAWSDWVTVTVDER
ncbi:hypothetical protein GCM10028784_09020 [Myceligenerans cantabricum]